jgi:hypothetical protein
VHEAQWVYIETTNSTSPGWPIETEPYDLAADPPQQHTLPGLRTTPRVSRMAARLRVLRPEWPT